MYGRGIEGVTGKSNTNHSLHWRGANKKEDLRSFKLENKGALKKAG